MTSIRARALLALLAMGAVLAAAQTEDPGAPSEPSPSASPPSAAELLDRALPVEIDTANYFELLQRLRELGLPDNGGRAELQQRLRTHFGIEPTPPAPPAAGRIIRIESAQLAEYFTVEEVDETYVRLRGGVVVTVDDRESDDHHIISAEEVIYNQSTESLTARGSVEYRLLSGGGEEVFRGQALSFDVATTEGAFVRGSTEREHFTGTDTITFRFSGERVVRLADDTIVLQDGQITSSPDPDAPNYEIRAREMWILAPSEWALRGATLFVGRIPVFYLPFFFRAGDELIFHPSLELDEQRGTVLNTTTYMIGRREQPETPFSFLRTTDDAQYEEVRSGLFLRKVPGTGQAESAAAGRFLKVMVDLYSRFGAFVGVEGALSGTESGSQLVVKGGIGASRTIYFDSQFGFTPYFVSTSGDAFSIWHDVNLFGGVVPLRYALDATFNHTGAPSADSPLTAWSLAATVEWLSDPGFAADFYNRQERIDWPALIGLPGDPPPFVPVRSTLTWEVNGKSDLRLRQGGETGQEGDGARGGELLERLSFPTLNARLFLQSRADAADYCAQMAPSFGSQAACDAVNSGGAIEGIDPTVDFYYPSTLRLPLISVAMAGTLLQAPAPAPTPTRAEAGTSTPIPGRGLRARSNSLPSVRQPTSGSVGQSDERVSAPTAPRPPRLPTARDDGPPPQFVEPFTAKLTYDVAPAVTVEETFDSDRWTTPTAVDFSQRYVTAQLTETSGVVGDVSVQGGLFRLRNTLTNTATYQTRFARGVSLSDGLDATGVDDGGTEDDAAWESLVTSDLAQTGTLVSSATRLSLAPLRGVPALAASSLSYDLGLDLYELAYAPGSGIANPIYQSTGPIWTADGVSQHSVQGRLALSTGEHTQSFTLSASLPPPTDPLDLAASLALAAAGVSGSVGTSVAAAVAPDPRLLDWELLRGAVDVRLGERLSVRQEVDVDVELPAIDRVSTTVTFAELSGTAVARLMLPLAPDGAVLGAAEQFLLQQLSFAYQLQPEPLLWWRNRIKVELGASTAWQINLQDFVNNALTFDFSLNVSIHEFLELGLATSSRNDRTYRYLPGLPERVGEVWVNPLQDLWWSFQFWNPANRRASSFNIQTMSLNLIHSLEDWNLSFEYAGGYSPNSSGAQLEWSPTFSLSVQWIPVPEISSDISGGDVFAIGQ